MHGQNGGQHAYTIGKHPGGPTQPVKEARRVLGEVVKGADPLADKIAGRKATTVAELCGQYLADVEAGRLLTRRKIAKTESTLISDRGRIARTSFHCLGVYRSIRSGETMLNASCTMSLPARQPSGRRPSHAVSRSYVAVVVSLGAPWHSSARSSPTPYARAFGSTIQCMGSSNSRRPATSWPMMSTGSLAWRCQRRDTRRSGSQPSPPHG